MTQGLALLRVLPPLVLAALACAFAAETAQAHGKRINLDEYCEEANYTGGIKLPFDPKWRAVYSTQRGAWTCVRPGTMGLEVRTGSVEVPLDPRKACQWKTGQSKAHFHEGGNVANQSSVHCGLADGLVSSQGSKPTVLRMCNRSDRPHIRAAFASWDTDNKARPGWTAEGWYGIARGECRDLEIATGFTGNVYIYGTDGSKTWSGDDARFCIDTTKSFEVTDSDQASCGAEPYKRVGMYKFAVRPGVNTWDFRK